MVLQSVSSKDPSISEEQGCSFFSSKGLLIACAVGILGGCFLLTVASLQSVDSVGFSATLVAGVSLTMVSAGGTLWVVSKNLSSSRIEETRKESEKDQQLLQENLFQAVREAATDKEMDGELALALEEVSISSRDYEGEAIGAIKAFISLGADIHQPEKESGKTLLALAEELNLTDVAKYLKSI